MKNILFLEEKPNVITRWLNVGTTTLMKEFHINCSRIEKHGRKEICLVYLPPQTEEIQCQENTLPPMEMYTDSQGNYDEIMPDYLEYRINPLEQRYDYEGFPVSFQKEERFDQNGSLDSYRPPPF
ncbi:MAG: hypothetical protein R3Y63_05625 [Eubacteriales bacterium]